MTKQRIINEAPRAKALKLLTENKKSVALGLSGGVDSSVAAALLLEQGYEVTGVFMQCWDAKADGCRADEDRSDAVKVASKLGIKFLSLDFVEAYKKRVISYFYSEYEAGRTPNPDVMCNKEIKFGLFFDWALENGFDYVATGHYARVTQEGNKFLLLQGVDPLKDQSYFLYLLDQSRLAHTLFPLGDYHKADVRKLAKYYGLHTSTKPDSVGICFIGEVNIKDFLQKTIPAKKGKVINTKGEVIGSHDGAWFYTIGQRHGFQITKYQGLPTYVLAKNVARNELVVGFAAEVQHTHFQVQNSHWVLEEPQNLKSGFACMVRIRHLGELYPCTLQLDGSQITVLLQDKVFGIAPGQSAVFYLNSVCLGGGIIVS